MMHLAVDNAQEKAWWLGPWNSSLPIPLGYATAGVKDRHYHAEMYEIYLVARGHSKAVVSSETINLEAGQVLIVEPGEVQSFVQSSEDYPHFVVQAPFVNGDKHAG